MEYIYLFFSSVVSLIINIFSPKKDNGAILLIRLDHLGDLVCTLSAINKIRENNPSRRIDILIGEWNAPLLENSKVIDNVYFYNSPAFTRDHSKIYTSNKKNELVRKLKQNNYTSIIAFRDDYFCSFLALQIFPSIRKDRGTFRTGLKIQAFKDLLNKKSSIPIHEIETNYLIAGLGSNWNDSIRNNNDDLFFFSTEEEGRFKNKMINDGLSENNYAIFHPGASWEFKRWSPQKFKAVAHYINEKYNLKVVLLGTPDEKQIARVIKGSDENLIIDKVGDTSLRETIYLILHSKIAVCNDSSLMHISAQSGIPTIGLMGPAEIEKFAPIGKNVIYYHNKVECYPCRMIDCKYPDNPCIELITVQDVKSGIDKLLKVSL